MIRPIYALVHRNLIKFTRDRMRLFFTLLMSGIFLFIFSFVAKATSTGLDHPMNYLIAGVIIMTVFQTSLNNAMNILEDISGGFMKEIIVAPIERWQIAIGQVISSTMIAVLQGCIIIIVGFFMGLRVDLTHAVLMVALMCLVGATFSSLGLYLATITKESANFQLVVTLVTMPLTFLSGAYIPTMVMPKLIMPVVYLNPLTYMTAAYRYITLHMEHTPVAELIKAGVAFDLNGFIITPLMSMGIVTLMGAVFFGLCVNRFGAADFSKIKIFRHGHR